MPGPDDPNAIELTVLLHGTIDEAWRLLVDAEHVRVWFGAHVQLDARPGGLFREEWSDGARRVVTSGRVVEFRPPSEIAWTWADDDWPCETRLTLRLEPGEAANTTALKLVHSGWSALETKSGRRLRDDHATGWRRHLQSLKTYAERAFG